MLSKEEVAIAIGFITRLPLGKYSVREIFGEEWWNNYRPRNYGKRFKASVRSGKMQGLRWVGVRSNRSQEYGMLAIEVVPPNADR